MSRLALLAVALLVPALPVHAQNSTHMSAADLQADVAVLKRAYLELHPGLYRYNTSADIERRFQALTQRFNRDHTLEEAFVAISQFLATLRCGHSYTNFVNQSDEVAAELFHRRTRLPFYFRWVDRRMIVTENFSSDERLGRGAEILTINGVPAGQVLDTLLTIARADGSNDAKRVSYLEVGGNGRYEAFDIYHPMFFPFSGGKIELRVRQPSGDTQVLDVAALTGEERLAPRKAREAARQGGEAPLWQLTYDPDGTALLRMDTWALYNSKWNWQAFLDSAFTAMNARRTATLVIDIRGNEGGLDVGDYLLAKLARHPIPVEPLTRKVRYRSVPADLRPYLDTWDPSFFDWGEFAVDPRDGFYRMTKWDEPGGGTIQPSASPFGGRVFVLIDAANSSATFQFAQEIKRNRLGTLVGQATGGNRRGINGGAFFFLRLPHSGIEVDLPLVGTFPESPQPDSGIEPDIPVIPNVQDIATGRDAELSAVKKVEAR